MTAQTNGDGRGKRHCGAQKRQGEGTCTRPAGWGTDHAGWGRCKLHGGSTQSLKQVAKREQAEDAVATYGLPRDIDPHTALAEEVARTAGHVAWLGRLVAELEQSDLRQFVPTGESGGKLEPSVWVELYQRERDHLRRVSADAVRAGVEERRVKLAESQGELIAQVIRGVLDDLGVAGRPEVPDVVRRHLSAVSA